MYLLLLVLEHNAIHGCLYGYSVNDSATVTVDFITFPHSVKPLNALAPASSEAVKTTVCCQICHLLPLVGAGIYLLLAWC